MKEKEFSLSKKKKKDWTTVGKERFKLHPSKLNKEEFNLSNKISLYPIGKNQIHIDDIKEFIKRLKEQIDEWEYYEKRFPHKETKWNRIKMRIDKLAGDKLT